MDLLDAYHADATAVWGELSPEAREQLALEMINSTPSAGRWEALEEENVAYSVAHAVRRGNWMYFLLIVKKKVDRGVIPVSFTMEAYPNISQRAGILLPGEIGKGYWLVGMRVHPTEIHQLTFERLIRNYRKTSYLRNPSAPVGNFRLIDNQKSDQYKRGM